MFRWTIHVRDPPAARVRPCRVAPARAAEGTARRPSSTRTSATKRQLGKKRRLGPGSHAVAVQHYNGGEGTNSIFMESGETAINVCIAPYTCCSRCSRCPFLAPVHLLSFLLSLLSVMPSTARQGASVLCPSPLVHLLALSLHCSAAVINKATWPSPMTTPDRLPGQYMGFQQSTPLPRWRPYCWPL